jgi:uncharacterized protein YbaR (Trm112 family)
MQVDSPGNNNLLCQWLDRLACPACQGVLRAEGDTILCIACARRYPILNGIPILIPDRAIKSEN